ncbi:Protein CBG25436 [Caenorhabditis briggsae]|uniref:Protein CBG25436 n=1 Tax=Caenorhabditis briggsae TaxID=6238 RepID=B6ILC9_CAEBR|nr:Protein CBG25436 [Caenorhabditis briggsae]CAS00709.1 Protein CBG25436 [Caenorhabditis briggsae]
MKKIMFSKFCLNMSLEELNVWDED